MPEKHAKMRVMKLKVGDLVSMKLAWGGGRSSLTNWTPTPQNISVCFGIVLETDNSILYNYARVRWFSVEHAEKNGKGICPRKEKTICWELIEDLQKIPTLTSEIEDATLSIE